MLLTQKFNILLTKKRGKGVIMATQFQKLLNKAFLEWCNERGEVLTKKEWANYIGIEYTQMAHYFAGRRAPVGNNLTKLTLAIGPRVLTSLGLIKDPMLKLVLNNFHELSQEQIESMMREARVTADERDTQELPANKKSESKAK